MGEKAPLFGPNLQSSTPGEYDVGPQFGGEVVNYQHNLLFITVHGSGHMVPEFRPEAAMRMLDRLLTGSTAEKSDDLTSLFSPPYPSNSTLKSVSDQEFEDALSKWTKTAKQFSLENPTSSVRLLV